MADRQLTHGRRTFLGGLAAAAVILPLSTGAQAQGFGLGLGNILGKASDSALDRLAQPGAFYDDEDIRIGLPLIGGGGGGGVLGSLFRAGSELGLLDGLVRKLNDAAGIAAGEAKPIFRSAIDGLSITDLPDIVSKGDGGTQYLRRSSSDELHGKLMPLVDAALGDLGAYRQLDELSKDNSLLRRAGISREGLNTSVTDQGLDGIFSYIGSEEKTLRANPLKPARGLLDGIFAP